MSITWETAAEWFETHMPTGKVKPVQKQAYLMALSALRPVSREQVEKVWRGEWTGNFNAHCSLCDAFNSMAYIGKGGNFCPSCGAPMTDEAVEMVVERLEALYDTSN